MDAFEVSLDGEWHRFFPGATVRDLVGRLGPEDQVAFHNGIAWILDEFGNRVGEGGALQPGGRYRVERLV